MISQHYHWSGLSGKSSGFNTILWEEEFEEEYEQGSFYRYRYCTIEHKGDVSHVHSTLTKLIIHYFQQVASLRKEDMASHLVAFPFMQLPHSTRGFSPGIDLTADCYLPALSPNAAILEYQGELFMLSSFGMLFVRSTSHSDSWDQTNIPQAL